MWLGRLRGDLELDRDGRNRTERVMANRLREAEYLARSERDDVVLVRRVLAEQEPSLAQDICRGARRPLDLATNGPRAAGPGPIVAAAGSRNVAGSIRVDLDPEPDSAEAHLLAEPKGGVV